MADLENYQKIPETTPAAKRRAGVILAQMTIDNELELIDGTWPKTEEEQLAWWLDLLGLNHREPRINGKNSRPSRGLRKDAVSLGFGPSPS